MKTLLLIGLLALAGCGKKAKTDGRPVLPQSPSTISEIDLEQFVASVERNDISTADSLLKLGANPNILLADGSTPLTFSLTRNHPSMIETLLNGGADPEKADKNGKVPLLLAFKNKDVASIKQLIVHGANINTLDSQQRSPLMLALIMEIPALPEWLIDRGANITIRDNRDRDAFMLARELGRNDIASKLHVTVLTARGAPDTEVIAGIYERGDAFALREFLLKRPDVLKMKLNPGHLLQALAIPNEKNSVESMEVLLNYGLSVEGDSSTSASTPLIEAAKAGLLAQTKLLLQNNAKIEAQDESGKTALMQATIHRHPLVVEWLLKKKAKKNYEVMTLNGKVKHDACVYARQSKQNAVSSADKKASDAVMKKLGCWFF